MTPRQTEKELQRQAVLFEEAVKHGKSSANGNIRFDAFCKIFLADYARLYLKAKTVDGYEKHLQKIMPGIGHFKLKDIRPAHIASLYKNLQEDGMREQSKATATCKINFAAWMKENQTCMAQISKAHQISVGALRRCKEGQPISIKNATLLAAIIGLSLIHI